ncbi:predicted protein [Thalassiosira pseudonana CCMP1335]|uniref:Uncharacterized protein n=1 Tax=Thalassiosira pseudonana TaxID=35128 RepID=B5YLG7_THAPS|nr:predicted protein [Thalassiosira pseudonana CCMP1335]ACI64079.1 predicted protein [Thalassiosira pseudonana CCMP1335]
MTKTSTNPPSPVVSSASPTTNTPLEPAVNSLSTQRTSSSIEQIPDDDDVAPLPTSMLHFAAMELQTDDDETKKRGRKASSQETHGGNEAITDTLGDASNEDQGYRNPTNTVGRSEEEYATTIGLEDTANAEPLDEGVDSTTLNEDSADSDSQRLLLERDTSVTAIPEAFLVEGGELAFAEPLHILPWWKQRRVKLVAVGACAVVVALAVALGVAFSITNTYEERINLWVENDEIVLEDGGKTSQFGSTLNLDGDLVLIGASDDDGGVVIVFQYDGSSWVQDGLLDMPPYDERRSERIAIFGNLIAMRSSESVDIYNYGSDGSLTSLQEPIPLSYGDWYGGLRLTEEHLVYAVGNGVVSFCSNSLLRQCMAVAVFDFVIYYRPNATEPFTFIRKLSMSSEENGFGGGFSLEGDIIVVGDVMGNVHLFKFRNGDWADALMLETPVSSASDKWKDNSFHSLHISKRKVMAVTDVDVHFFDIDECEPMPTSLPSESPSLSPSETCYWVQITTRFYRGNPPKWSFNETTQMANNNEPLPNIPTTYPTSRPTYNHVISIPGLSPWDIIYRIDGECLKAGSYDFTIYNDPVYYNISSNGQLIAEGGDFGYKQTTKVFFIPYISSSPSMSLSPSHSPSSSSPTETCYWIEVAIAFDISPYETQWTVEQLDGEFAIDAFNFTNEPSYGYDKERHCLPIGRYQFIIWDSAGDGLCCFYGSGNYTITSNDELIAEGGEFGFNETTIFDVPYDQI